MRYRWQDRRNASRVGAARSASWREPRPCYSKDVAKVTSKLQVTVPKVLAEQYGIRPGDEIDWQAAGDAIRIVRAGGGAEPLSCKEKLDLFDRATARQRQRERRAGSVRPSRSRGWTRADAYHRGRAR
jgi:bifunctional DNA-binding transcriptional regulator/antitoxin component of YhaV-PrlF toxin-antitoxin module